MKIMGRTDIAKTGSVEQSVLILPENALPIQRSKNHVNGSSPAFAAFGQPSFVTTVHRGGLGGVANFSGHLRVGVVD
jgi:hypothetical protein